MTKGKFLFCCVLLAALAYCGVTFYPSVFFSSNYVYKNLTLYTHDPLRESPDKLLSAIYEKISSDDFYNSDQNLEVYLTGRYREYVFLAPFCRKDYSCVHPLSSKVFIASSDMDKNLAYAPRRRGIGRDLAGVITHELVKAQIKDKMGFLNYAFLPDWRKEGYAEHIAMETQHLDPAAFCAGNSGTDLALPYLENRLIVEMLKAEDDISYPVLIKGNYSHEGVLSRVEQKYCGRVLSGK